MISEFLLVFIGLQICDSFELKDGGETLPPMNFNILNKTDHEIAIEECMKEFITCIKANRKSPICGMDSQKNKRYFSSFCELEYENCKIEQDEWRYYDDSCSGVTTTSATLTPIGANKTFI